MKTISDHILDILQNSVRADATFIEIIITENKKNDFYALEITDNGCGMDDETLKKVTDPFFTSRVTRKVGLGLSLLKQKAEGANGFLKISSQPKQGTKVKAVFQLSNIDRPPLGDIWETYYFSILSYQYIEIKYIHSTEKGKFEICSNEIKETLDNVPLKNREIKKAIYELIKNNLEIIEATL